jgi:exodeoxyribonuclease V alpha subunit
VPLAVELLEVPAELIQSALRLELAERTVIADTVGETARIFLAGLYRAEQVGMALSGVTRSRAA